jgi:iron complex outermembrane receptor protein
MFRWNKLRSYLINFNSTKLSLTFGWYIRYLQSVNKFGLFGELIYREGFTGSDNSKINQSYNLNTGIIYYHSPNISIKPKGENLLNNSVKSVFLPIPPMLLASVFNAYDRKILVTIEKIF